MCSLFHYFIISFLILFQRTNPYCRTLDTTMKSMKNEIRYKDPEKVFEKFLNPDDKLGSSKNLKQSQNLKYQSSLEDRDFQKKGNIADHAVQLQELLKDKNNPVKIIWNTEETLLPNVILYNNDVINDIRAHCGTMCERKAVLGVDKTYNLGPCYLTVLTYRNRNLINTSKSLLLTNKQQFFCRTEFKEVKIKHFTNICF